MPRRLRRPQMFPSLCVNRRRKRLCRCWRPDAVSASRLQTQVRGQADGTPSSSRRRPARSQRHAEEAVRRGEPQVIDVQSLSPSPETDALLASDVRVYMVVPMITRDELIGSISFGGPTGEFPPERVRIAQEVAAQLAIAITQARLQERVKQHAAELEQRVEERTLALRAANEQLQQEIAERRRAEEEADRANRAKSDFLSRMSHEL